MHDYAEAGEGGSMAVPRGELFSVVKMWKLKIEGHSTHRRLSVRRDPRMKQSICRCRNEQIRVSAGGSLTRSDSAAVRERERERERGDRFALSLARRGAAAAALPRVDRGRPAVAAYSANFYLLAKVTNGFVCARPMNAVVPIAEEGAAYFLDGWLVFANCKRRTEFRPDPRDF